MTSLSVIIPWCDDFEVVEQSLVSVLENRPDGCEVIVAHQGSYDDPYDLASEVRFVEVADDTSACCMINRAAEAADGEFLLLLRQGVQTTEAWAEPLADVFANPAVASISPVVLESPESRRIATAGVRYGGGGTRKLVMRGKKYRPNSGRVPQVDGPSSLAAIYRRDVFLNCGGYDDSVGVDLADVDLAMTLQACGYESCVAMECAFVGSPVASSPWTFEKGRRHERLFWRHANRSGGLTGVFAHLFAIAGSSLSALPKLGALTQLIGRLRGCLERAGFAEYQDFLASCRAQKMAIGSEFDDADSDNLNHHDDDLDQDDDYLERAA